MATPNPANSVINGDEGIESSGKGINSFVWRDETHPSQNYLERASDMGRAGENNEIIANAYPMDDSKMFPANYRGSQKVWVGALALLILGAGIVASLVYYGITLHDNIKDVPLPYGAGGRDIRDGAVPPTIEEEDVVNPEKYENQGCLLPNYESKNNAIYATTPDGRSRKMNIKGISWSGMETPDAAPYGLWSTGENSAEGTTLYQIGNFLSRNKFNSVRLPLAVESILINQRPNENIIDQYNHKALNIKGYMDLLKGIINGLAYWKISVLLDFDRLKANTSTDDLWYSHNVPQQDVELAIEMLTTNLCNDDYWNVIGIDLKNQPRTATWGDNTITDWRKGATQLGNRVLKGCPNWVVFVNGIRRKETSPNINGRSLSYYDWYGGGLQQVGEFPLKLLKENKVVWAPHYYNPSVERQPYFYQDPASFTELSDSALNKVINTTMTEMFGYLGPSGSAIVLAGFGGLYTTDEHPKLTNQRVTRLVMNQIATQGTTYTGGYLWSLNPEAGYQYNAGKGEYSQYGLLKKNWLDVNLDYLTALTTLDSMRSLTMFPCFQPTTTTAKSSK